MTILNAENNMKKLLKMAIENGYYWDCCDLDFEYFNNGEKEVAVLRDDIDAGNIHNIAW